MQRRCNAAVVSCVATSAVADQPARAQHRARGAPGRMAARRAAPRASAPTRWPRRSARASRPPTTCSSACATRAWPCTTPAACTGSRPGFARWSRAPPTRRPTSSHDLSGVVDELLARTHKRSYLRRPARRRAARRRSSAARRACPSCPGSSPQIADNAHALALGKVVLALAPPEVVERYLAAPGCGASRAHTITDPDALRDELREVRRRGVAADREEFDEDFCCLAAPVLDPARRVARRRSGSR